MDSPCLLSIVIVSDPVVSDSETLWFVAYQAPLSMGFHMSSRALSSRISPGLLIKLDIFSCSFCPRNGQVWCAVPSYPSPRSWP